MFSKKLLKIIGAAVLGGAISGAATKIPIDSDHFKHSTADMGSAAVAGALSAAIGLFMKRPQDVGQQ